MSHSIARISHYFISFLELAIAILLGVSVLLSLFKLAGEAVDLAVTATFQRQHFVTFLDEALLMIVSIDLMRTLITGIQEKHISVIIVIEAALIFIVREIITMELRDVSETRLLIYVVVFGALFVAWLIGRRQVGIQSQEEV
ncbi:phosphate-starvation-inducible PsiE family protein [Thermofilum sp.]|uniref:phosphate-starvation-inducible PsiE family protein n=1 Tax=Thermofilum sp. TaxID=1961369 RepID=UPI00258DCA00|nr:phosphate-starvation-inducible PsiE family protein [Thermofilum sp.]